MSQNIDVKVPIKEDLKKGLIFGLEARLPIGVILGFSGFTHEALPLMQNMSNATRAYIYNADLLPGFIQKFEIIKLIKVADRGGQLQNVKEWLNIDIDKLTVELDMH